MGGAWGELGTGGTDSNGQRRPRGMQACMRMPIWPADWAPHRVGAGVAPFVIFRDGQRKGGVLHRGQHIHKRHIQDGGLEGRRRKKRSTRGTGRGQAGAGEHVRRCAARLLCTA